jgi:hypothetical protein
MKYTVFCGEKKGRLLHHVSKNAVIILVDYIYEIQSLGDSPACVVYVCV